MSACRKLPIADSSTKEVVRAVPTVPDAAKMWEKAQEQSRLLKAGYIIEVISQKIQEAAERGNGTCCFEYNVMASDKITKTFLNKHVVSVFIAKGYKMDLEMSELADSKESPTTKISGQCYWYDVTE